MYPIWLFKGADEELGGESLADTDAPACQTGASWKVASDPKVGQATLVQPAYVPRTTTQNP